MARARSQASLSFNTFLDVEVELIEFAISRKSVIQRNGHTRIAGVLRVKR
jgi:hypothetical protein